VKISSVLTEILGLAFVVLGLALGAVQGHPLGGMVGLSVGIATIVIGAYIINDDR